MAGLFDHDAHGAPMVRVLGHGAVLDVEFTRRETAENARPERLVGVVAQPLVVLAPPDVLGEPAGLDDELVFW